MIEHAFKTFGTQATPPVSFLQSPAWEEVLEAEGKRTHRVHSLLCVEHTLPLFGKYWYCPDARTMPNEQSWQEIIHEGKKNNARWIRVDLQAPPEFNRIEDYSVCKAPHDMQPKEILIIDITKSPEILLKEMKPKTRYNIRLAQRKGVKTFAFNKHHEHAEKYFKKFYALVQEAAQRAGIKAHPIEHYRAIFQNIPSDRCQLYVAEYNGRVLAANLVIFSLPLAIYLHGGSSDSYRNLMAPYLLQWQQILDAQKRGCTQYDFGGVALEHKEKWAGITRFKLGFSPDTKPTQFSGSYDIVIKKMPYRIYRLLSWLKKQMARYSLF